MLQLDMVDAENEIRVPNHLQCTPLISNTVSSPLMFKKLVKYILQPADISADTQKFWPLCKEFSSISQHSADVGHTRLLTMKIDTSDDPPMVNKLYPMALKHEWVRNEINALEKGGFTKKEV